MPFTTQKMADYWPRIDELIARAADDGVRSRLQYGTPEIKLAELNAVGLDFEDLVFIHGELSKIVFQGSLKFWWW